MANLPSGFITLLDAFARVGSQVLPGWTDETLSPHLWVKSDVQGLAHWRWFEVTGWLEHEINSGALTLYFLNARGEADPVDADIGARDGASFFLTGRLTNMTRQQALEWLATDRESDEPLLLLDRGRLQAAIDADLRPDESEYWSFAGLLAWICWRRYDKYRQYANSLSGFLFEELRTYYSDGSGIVMSGPDGLRDLWSKLANARVRALGLPGQGSAPRTEIPAHEFQDYRLGDAQMIDALIFERPVSQTNVVAYYSPAVRRLDALALWPPETGPALDTVGIGAAYAPDRAEFHPEGKANWNIPMAVLWIAHRSYDRVVEGMLEWSDNAVFIRDLETNMLYGPGEIDGPPSAQGYRREPMWRPRLARLLVDRPERDSYRHAFDELRMRIAAKSIATFAVANGESVQIPPFKWLHLEPVSEPGHEEYFGAADVLSSERFFDAYVAREDIERQWPSPQSDEPGDQPDEEADRSKRNPDEGEVLKDYNALRTHLRKEPSRDELAEWRRSRPYYLPYKEAMALKTDRLPAGRPRNPEKKVSTE